LAASDERWMKTGCDGVNGAGGNKARMLDRYALGEGGGDGVDREEGRSTVDSEVVGGGEKEGSTRENVDEYSGEDSVREMASPV